MRRLLPIVLGAVVGLTLGVSLGVARASYVTAGATRGPSPMDMAVKAPTIQNPGSASEVHVVLTGKGKAVDLFCGMDCRWLSSAANGSACTTTCTSVTCFPLTAKTTRLPTLPLGHDCISVWATAAGEVSTAEHFDP